MYETSEIESSEWNRLGSTYYERRTLYHWDGWNTGRGGTHRVASARNGGPVAVVVSGSTQVVQLWILSSSGRHLSRVAYEASSDLLQFGWTHEEQLVCIHRDGRVLQHDVHGQVMYDSYPLRSAFHGQFVTLCRIWDDGIVVLTSRNQLLAISLSDTSPRITNFVTAPLVGEVTAIEINELRHTTLESLEVFLTCGGSLVKSDINKTSATKISAGEPIMLKISPSGQFIAVVTTEGRYSIFLLLQPSLM